MYITDKLCLQRCVASKRFDARFCFVPAKHLRVMSLSPLVCTVKSLTVVIASALSSLRSASQVKYMPVELVFTITTTAHAVGFLAYSSFAARHAEVIAKQAPSGK